VEAYDRRRFCPSGNVRKKNGNCDGRSSLRFPLENDSQTAIILYCSFVRLVFYFYFFNRFLLILSGQNDHGRLYSYNLNSMYCIL